MNKKSQSTARLQLFTNPAWMKGAAKFALMPIGCLVLSGCIGTQTKTTPNVAYQYQPQHSKALNLMMASGTMVEGGEIVDAEIKRLDRAGEAAVEYQERREAIDNFSDTVGVIDGSLVMSGVYAAPVGVSSGFHGGMMLLSLLDSPYIPSFMRTHIVAIMPGDLAKSGEAAAEQLEAMMREALIKSLPDEANFELFEHHWKPVFGSKTVSLIGVLTGGECNKSEVEFTGPGDQPVHTGCQLGLDVRGDPALIKGPEWLGQGEAYLFRPDLYKARGTRRGEINFWVRVRPKDVGGFLDSIEAKQQIEQNLGELSRDSLLLKMTEHMPPWFYVYIAPTKEDPVPKIYQRGNVLYFARYVDQEGDGNHPVNGSLHH